MFSSHMFLSRQHVEALRQMRSDQKKKVNSGEGKEVLYVFLKKKKKKTFFIMFFNSILDLLFYQTMFMYFIYCSILRMTFSSSKDSVFLTRVGVLQSRDHTTKIKKEIYWRLQIRCAWIYYDTNFQKIISPKENYIINK